MRPVRADWTAIDPELWRKHHLQRPTARWGDKQGQRSSHCKRGGKEHGNCYKLDCPCKCHRKGKS